ncbi:MAG TPA: phenylalanine--tRNA ligase subunit beta, partial [Thermoanaerobaculia bacterium]|nr:phenylalanine--tRNA ligase subunit beta [Thermoanaerobaculia bacterium]
MEVPERCHRFAARMIRGISPAASAPVWRTRMESLGLKAIAAAVDATNISLWGLGQPLHAFDADRVTGGRLVVRTARPGEKVLCLDGVERELHPEDVVVADERRVLSIAGVIGGVDSAISGETRNVLLEAAWWDPVSIRRTARRHGLHTDASHRYERGADVEAIPEGLALASGLILDAAGGELLAGEIDEYPRRFVPRVVRLRVARLAALTGLELPLARAAEILERLGFGVTLAGDALDATVPSWRPDVAIEEDLVEEVARIHGYSKIPFALPPAEALSPLYLASGAAPAPRETEDRAADEAREAGLFEAMNFPFVAAAAESPFGNLLGRDAFRPEPLVVTNPLDAGRPCLRRLLLPGLLESASANHRAGRRSIALFEIGRVWDRPAPPGADPAEIESRHFAAVLAGDAPDAFPVRPVDLLDAKGIVRRLVLAVAGEEPAFESGEVAGAPGLLVSVGGRPAGVLARVAGAWRGDLPLPAAAVAAEIDLGALSRAARPLRYAEYSRFPAADVDVTFSCGPGISWRDVAGTIARSRLAHLEEAELLKLYVDPARPETRNITVRLTFRAADRTLSQQEVNSERDRLIETWQQKFG